MDKVVGKDEGMQKLKDSPFSKILKSAQVNMQRNFHFISVKFWNFNFECFFVSANTWHSFFAIELSHFHLISVNAYPSKLY